MKKMENNSEFEFKELICEMHKTEMSRLPENKELKENYHLSDLFYQKMKVLLKKMDSQERRRRYVKYVASAAIVILVLGMVSNPQYLVEAKNNIVEWFEDHVNFRFGQEDVKTIPRYEFGYVPDGYELVMDEYFEEGMGFIQYVNNEKELSLSYVISSSDLNLNNENVEFKTFKIDSGIVIYYFFSMDSNTESTMTWTCDDRNIVFTLIGIISEDEMINVVDNIRVLKK